jgi:hypothetical protein
LAPKRYCPPFREGFVGRLPDSDSVFIIFFSTFAASDTRTPRSALTLPSLCLQVCRRHDNTYKRLSCLGKISGRFPFS